MLEWSALAVRACFGFRCSDFGILRVMPANLTPEYMKADKWYRTATTSEEKILALEEMLRVIPKHKGTEHMRADLRKKLSKLKDAESQPKKSGGHVDIFHVPRSGAGQVVLIGTPNTGKSSIVAALTKAKVQVTDFPFATGAPVPGMAKFEDVPIELVDMPPITADYSAAGQVGTYRNCDLVAIVIDLSGDVAEQLAVCLEFLESRSLLAAADMPAHDEHGNALGKKAFCICTKSDIAPPGALDALKELCDYPFEFVAISTETVSGLDTLMAKIFKLLGIIRIYAKPPGKGADMTEPFTLPTGSTVIDLAYDVHRQLAERLKSARIWGTGVHDGQNVQKTHVLSDKDIVELHFS
ncbi:MAG: TGS domain-containing protein [Sedimentisphaerales bacterium]|nr:TGS domain-containing protein [Sedimentisphaerales bacterium]